MTARFPLFLPIGSRLALAVAAALGLASCAPTATHEGQRPAKPAFVSLNPCTDAILVEVADPSQVLALSHYSMDPASSSIPAEVASKFAATGGAVEEIAALDPDLVLAASFISPATRNALDRLGFRTETFGIASDEQGSFEQIRRIAALAGHPERGEALIGRIESALAANRAREGEPSVSTVLWQPGDIVPGEQALVSGLMRNAGLSSHSSAIGMGQADYLSLEQMLASPPQLLLVAGDSRAQHHPALKQLENTRVETLDPSLLYCGGPTIIRAAERLGAIRRSMT